MVRFAPFATVKVLSINSVALRKIEESGTSPQIAIQEAIREFAGDIANNYTALWNFLNTNFGIAFTNIGLARDISISTDYGTREVFGIGQPTDPALVPNNKTVRVSVSRLSTDSRSITEYVTSPDFWYNPGLQEDVLRTMYAGNPENGSAGADYPLYTYLAISDLEQGGVLPNDFYQAVLNYELIAFMPRSYSKRITAGDAIITLDVEGTGKVLRLSELVGMLTGYRPGPSKIQVG